MDDDDEFGDLYTDVLRPLSSPALPPSEAAGGDGGGENGRRSSRSSPPALSLQRKPDALPTAVAYDDWMLGDAADAVEQPMSWEEEDDGALYRIRAAPAASPARELPPGDLKADDEEARVRSSLFGKEIVIPGVSGDDLMGERGLEKEGAGDFGEEPVIPGLSAAEFLDSGFVANIRTSRSSSDSDDGIHIVLNDIHHVPPRLRRAKGLGSEDDDEDGDGDMIIVTDSDRHNQHIPGLEAQEWGEEAALIAPDGEAKEAPEGAKGNAIAAGVAGPRIGYSNHGFHSQHHFMYKYIRPGVTHQNVGSAGASISAPAQVRPLSIGPAAGRGRGEWRPPTGRGVSIAQKGSHSGFGTPAWGNGSSVRSFGSGSDFTLPPHKNIFDIDLDSFEEKPWKHPGIDSSDFFNFGLDEDGWKAYCKQLDQFRLGSTTQSKIRLYDSGRSEQDYDPDLPPELAAATGLQDTADNFHYGKTENGQADHSSQAKTSSIRPTIPTGRAIQVEGGYGERLPSADTRPPRVRDADSVIEIICQDLTENSAYDGTFHLQNNAPHRDHAKGVQGAEDDDHPNESEHTDQFSHYSNGKKRGIVSGHVPFTPGDDVLLFPPEMPVQNISCSKLRDHVYPSEYGDRPHGRSRGQYSSTGDNHSVDATSSPSGQEKRSDDQEEKSGDTAEDQHFSGVSPTHRVEAERESSVELMETDRDDKFELADSIEIEGESVPDSDMLQGINFDPSLTKSPKKQKLSSSVVQPAFQDSGDCENLRAAHDDIDNLRRSVNDRKRHYEDGEEEVVSDGRGRRTGDSRRHHEEEEREYRRKDDYGRDVKQEMDTNRIAPKGRSDASRLHQHRDLDTNSRNSVRERNDGLERLKERDVSVSLRPKREDDVHRRRAKDEDIRRDRMEDIGSRQRNKPRINDRNNINEETIVRKKIDDVEWRSRDRETASRARDRGDVLMSRREEVVDPHARRRDDHVRREKIEKEDSLHGYKARDDASRRKREREKDDAADRKRREDAIRSRDRLETYHSSRHKDDNWHQKAREDRQRFKHPHEDAQRNREREDRGTSRNERVVEEKHYGGPGNCRDGSKSLVSDKDTMLKDRRRHTEHPHRDSTSEERLLQHKVHEDTQAHENKSTENRISRHEKSVSNSDRSSNTSSAQQRYRNNTRKNSDGEALEEHIHDLSRRNHEDHSSPCSDQGNTKILNEDGNNSIFPNDSRQHSQPHYSSINEEEGFASDEENVDLRRGRSKLERWTSNKERDFSAISSRHVLSSSITKVVDGSDADTAETEGLTWAIGNCSVEQGPKDADNVLVSDKSGEDLDKHLDTVAKLKRRSERFNLPMPGEKELAPNKKADNEAQHAQSDAGTDADVMPERPPRKRRWADSNN